jgi:hypothetical protein
MKIISIQEIREKLAGEDAENIYEYKDLYDVFLNGCSGYTQFKDEDCVEWYVARGHLYNSHLEDEEPVEVAHITNDNKELLYVVHQYCGEVQLTKV